MVEIGYPNSLVHLPPSTLPLGLLPTQRFTFGVGAGRVRVGVVFAENLGSFNWAIYHSYNYLTYYEKTSPEGCERKFGLKHRQSPKYTNFRRKIILRSPHRSSIWVELHRHRIPFPHPHPNWGKHKALQ